MIRLEKIEKHYLVGDETIRALKGIDLDIEKGKFTVILGPSGSGKSTLLNILGGMDKVTTGRFQFEQTEVNQLSAKELSTFRREKIGFVFQFYNLVPSLTALENIAIAANLTGNDQEARKYLDLVGLAHRANNFPNQLSGGEMQRVSIARALAKKPSLLLCDEPTGALDSKTSLKILELLKAVSENPDTAVVMVTHNSEFAQVADKVIRLHDGMVEQITVNDKPTKVSEVEL